ncbi:hypothetical protein Ade02nite_33700 [Paractinoplanes deccanensis]|uniref:DUF2795 domain-containing protein n=1 Tax=Paractinoplanes deccanensis TaxID=113561 RepID=A0ABQ3Y410_9ACTN|nr:DUF2795 domain-containing protein [Actinoplanes deccanensis]GID74729.1 hypothetical protein Ade02nite_33700 [Actinoplanes deccanensis]
MERGSNKVSPRIDEQLDQELGGNEKGRAEEWKMAEPSGEDQPSVSPVAGSDPSNDLSRFGRYIGLSALPGDREALRQSAETLGAPDDVLADIDSLPPGVAYENVSQIWSALGRG